MEMRNSQLEHGQPMEQTRGFFAPVSRLVNDFDVRSVFTGN